MVKQDNYSITLAKSLLSFVRFYTCKNMRCFPVSCKVWGPAKFEEFCKLETYMEQSTSTKNSRNTTIGCRKISIQELLAFGTRCVHNWDLFRKVYIHTCAKKIKNQCPLWWGPWLAENQWHTWDKAGNISTQNGFPENSSCKTLKGQGVPNFWFRFWFPHDLTFQSPLSQCNQITICEINQNPCDTETWLASDTMRWPFLW